MRASKIIFFISLTMLMFSARGTIVPAFFMSILFIAVPKSGVVLLGATHLISIFLLLLSFFVSQEESRKNIETLALVASTLFICGLFFTKVRESIVVFSLIPLIASGISFFYFKLVERFKTNDER